VRIHLVEREDDAIAPDRSSRGYRGGELLGGSTRRRLMSWQEDGNSESGRTNPPEAGTFWGEAQTLRAPSVQPLHESSPKRATPRRVLTGDPLSFGAAVPIRFWSSPQNLEGAIALRAIHTRA